MKSNIIHLKLFRLNKPGSGQWYDLHETMLSIQAVHVKVRKDAVVLPFKMNIKKAEQAVMLGPLNN